MAESSFLPEELAPLRQVFLAEAREHVEALDAAAARLASASVDGDGHGAALALTELLRTAHTLKGSAGSVELDGVAEAAHRLEETLVPMRDAGGAPAIEGVARLGDGIDDLRRRVARLAIDLDPAPGRAPDLDGSAGVDPPPSSTAAHASVSRGRRDLPRSAPATTAAARHRGVDPRAVDVAAFDDALTPRPVWLAAEQVARTDPDPAREAERRALERRSLDRRRAGGGDPASIRVEVERVDELLDAAGELVIDRTRLARRQEELAGCARDLAAARASLRHATDGVERSPPAADDARAQRDGALPAAPGDLARALAVVEDELAAAAAALDRATAGVAEDLDGLRRTATVLQDGIQRLRIVRVGRLFARLSVPLHELARRAGKQIAIITDGEDTEIDRAAVERVADPLLHLLRNAVAHGVEDPAARRAAGKPERGEVRLSARQRGAEVVLSVSDDGAGIDLARVRDAMVRAGMLAAATAADAPDADLLHGVFAHGLSTRDAADHLAGRGVGLDVVRDAVARLGGEITCRSTAGVGTTFTIRLPLTTAIARALLFKVGGNVYALPTTSVLETAEVAPGDVSELDDGTERLRVGATRLPLVRLGALLGEPAPAHAVAGRRRAVVLDHDGHRFAVTCDKLIGPREIVVKSLGPLLAPLPLYAGATVSGAGKVQLILDVGTLARMSRAPSRLGRRPRDEGGARVLVADDSDSLRETASLLLARGGYRVEVAADGWGAWELLQDRPYDLVLTDVEMPRLDGYELCARIRASVDLASTAVLVMTSRSGEAVRRRAAEAGADGVLVKPLVRGPLLLAVEAALERARAR